MKTKKLTALMATLVCAASLLGGCGSDKDGGSAEEKAHGYLSTSTYQEYTDLGGYGSDFVMINYHDLILYEDNTFSMDVHYFNYAPAWSVICAETDATVTGSYTVSFEDEYGMSVELIADRVQSRVSMGETAFYDTDDISTFADTEEATAEQLRQDMLSSYNYSGVEIDFESNTLILPAQ